MEEIQAAMKPVKFVGLHRAAWIEMAIFFAVCFLLSFILGSRDLFFTASPHPFWIIVILLSVQFGTLEGFAAAFFSTVILFLGTLPDQPISLDRFEYLIYLFKNPFLWFLSALIIGELRAKQLHETGELKMNLLKSEKNEKSLLEAYNTLNTTKERLETQLRSEMKTALDAYEAFKHLENLSAEEILDYASNLVSLLMHPLKHSVYKLTQQGLEKVRSEGWEENDLFSEQFFSSTLMFREIVSRRRVLSMINKDDRQILEDEGLIATPLLDLDTDQVHGMIKIEATSFLQLNLSMLETFQTIGEWIGKAYSHRCQSPLTKEGDADFHTSLPYFERQKEFIINLAERLNFDVTMLNISLIHTHAFSFSEKQQAAQLLNQVVKSCLRGVDQANQPYAYQKIGDEFSILLPGTSKVKAQNVVTRIQKNLKEILDSKDPFQFAFHIMGLYEKK